MNRKHIKEANEESVMEKYKITIEEILVDEFEVFADNAEEAMKIAAEKYVIGDFVLYPGEVQRKQMAINEPWNETTEFVEF